MPDHVTLKIGDTLFGGWTDARVRRSMERIAGDFELSVSERWPGQQSTHAIGPGDRCTVSLGADTVIDGYIDDAEPSYSAGNHTVSLRGRERTGDLVDCSAAQDGGEWTNAKLDKIAADLVRPFGLEVDVTTDIGAPFKSFAIEQGETAFEAIERACRLRAVLPTSDGRGRILLSRAGSDGAATALISGKNILSASGTYSLRDRYSVYTVIGQKTGGDDASGEAVSQLKASAKDLAVTRHRPMTLIAEVPSEAAQMKVRAKWEAGVRAARARRASVTVQGWRDGDGVLWRPNTEVPVKDSFLGIDKRMLISSVEYALDTGGSRTTLSLVRPAAFVPVELAATADARIGH